MKQIRLIIVGLGNVGSRLLELLESKRDLLRARFNLEILIVGAADTSGAAFSKDGLDISEIVQLKRTHKGIATYPKLGQANMTPRELVQAVPADILVELSLTNLKDGEPGLSTIRDAIERGMNIVTANKGPLVLAYSELARLAQNKEVQLLHSATVTGGLPTLNIGTRDLGVAVIEKFEGIVNGTTNYILSRMSEGQSYDEALKQAQDIGMAEADPSLDVDGWDAANKLVIIANAVLKQPTTLKDLQVEGIRRIRPEDLIAAQSRRQTIKLIALAEKHGDNYHLSVRPTPLENVHLLASVGAGMMAIIYHTDINGTIFSLIEEHDPYPTSAAVLRDIVQAAS